MQCLAQKVLGGCGSCGVSVMALSVAGGDGNLIVYLFIFIDPLLQIAEGIAAKLEIVPGDGVRAKRAALAASCGCFLAGWLRGWQRLRARGGFERRAKGGGRRFGNAGRMGKPGIGCERRAVIDGGRFRRPRTIRKLWIGSLGVIWPCRR